MFKVFTVDDGHPLPLESLPCGAITPKLGMALTQSSGNLAIATGTTKPTYISMVDRDTACTAGELIQVVRVSPDTIFETTFSATATSIKPGDKVTLHASNGLQVTATTTSGVAEVISMDGTASGDAVRVRF